MISSESFNLCQRNKINAAFFMIPQKGLSRSTSSLERVITNAIHTLVKGGLCWWYWKYEPGDVMLEGLEKEAREKRKGCALIRHASRRGNGESEVSTGS